MGTVCSSESNRRNTRRINGNNDTFSASEFESTKTANQNSFYEKNSQNNNSIPSKNNENKEYNILESNTIFKTALESHNKYRRHYGSKELTINYDLCELAQKYAEKCADTESTDHFPYLYNEDIISENIKEINDGNINISKICEEWSQELMNNNVEQKFHANNMLWKETKEVGFGLSTSTKGKTYFVAFYYPAGNIFPELKDNI